MRLVFTDWNTMSMNGDLSSDCFESYSEIVKYPYTKPEDVIKNIGDAEMVLCNKTLISDEVFCKCPNLRYIGVLATGYNTVDIDSASKHGVVVCNAGTYSTMAVAQHTFAMILYYYNKISLYDVDVKNDAWKHSPQFSYFPYSTMELSGKTLSVIGYGSIGRQVAKIGEAFGMHVIVSTRTTPKDCPFELVSLEQAFKEADILTIHTPLTPYTINMVCWERLKTMKPTAMLVNTARGGIVVEKDLAKALQQGIIAQAAIDVLQEEPMKTTPLDGLSNCLITPHIAWTPHETRKRLLDISLENVKLFLQGTPQNVVSAKI